MKKYYQILFALLSCINMSYGTRVLPVDFREISGRIINTPITLKLTELQSQEIQKGDDNYVEHELGHQLYQLRRQSIGQYRFARGNTHIAEDRLIASVVAIDREYEVIRDGEIKKIRFCNLDNGSIAITRFELKEPIDLDTGFYSFEEFRSEPMALEVQSEGLMFNLDKQRAIRLSSLTKTLKFAETLGEQTKQSTFKAFVFLYGVAYANLGDKWYDYYLLEQVLDQGDMTYSINFFYEDTTSPNDIFISRLFLVNRSGQRWYPNRLLSLDRKRIDPKIFVEIIPKGFYAIRCQFGAKLYNFDREFAFDMDFLKYFCESIRYHVQSESYFFLSNSQRSNLPIEDVYRGLNLRIVCEDLIAYEEFE